jgi:hypothetical protein
VSGPVRDVDPFDLPDWLGEGAVVWTSAHGVRHGHHVAGLLTTPAHDDVPCDLLAVDDAYPRPVADDDVRTRAHLAWRHGQILLLEVDGRLTLAVPGTSFTADLVLAAVARLAKAVGASADDYSVQLRIGADRPAWEGSEF